jgi:hypothetical protein
MLSLLLLDPVAVMRAGSELADRTAIGPSARLLSSHAARPASQATVLLRAAGSSETRHQQAGQLVYESDRAKQHK